MNIPNSNLHNGYGPLLALRGKVYPSFEADQKKAAASIYKRLHPLILSKQITTIIDWGCGTGEILSSIKGHIDDELSLRKAEDEAGSGSSKKPGQEEDKIIVYYIGLDEDANEIASAKARCPSITWQEGKAEEFLDYKTTDGNNVDWSRTCVICTGHTLPHFIDWNKIENILNTYSPKFFLFDLFHTFDEAIRTARQGIPHNEAMAWYVTPDDIVDCVEKINTIRKNNPEMDKLKEVTAIWMRWPLELTSSPFRG